MKENMEEFFDLYSSEKGINTSELFVGKCLYRSYSQGAAEDVADPYRILIESRVEVEDNKFYIDIVNGIVLGDIDGISGFMGVPNVGFLATEIEPLSNKTDKKRMTYDELWQLTRELNNLDAPTMGK